jgi:tetratricopeptide (TPR) repeat protein
MQHKLCISLTFLLMVSGAIDLSQATTIQEARLQYHTEKLSLALAETNALLKTNPESISALFLKAQIQTENHQTDKAIETYKTLITLDTNHLQAYNNLAALYAQQGKLELASETLELAILTDPVYTTIHINLRAIYQDISKNHYRQALNLEPDYNQTPVASIDLDTDTDQILDEEIQVAPKYLRAAINTNLSNNTVTIRKRAVPTKPLNSKKLAVAPAKVDSQPDPANEVKTKLLEWAKAWSNRDASQYIQAYKNQYTPSAKTPEEWAASRRWNFKNTTYIKVSLSQIRIKADGRQYRAEFTQRYESDAYEDTVNKEIVFVRENGQWKIDAESSI